MGKLIFAVAVLCLLVLCSGIAVAQDITAPDLLASVSEGLEAGMLCDNDWKTTQTVEEGALLTLKNAEGVGGIYLIFDKSYGTVTLSGPEGEEYPVDTDGILHFYLDVQSQFPETPEEITLCFSDGPASVNELRIFSPGATPQEVQCWERIPEGETDLMLFSAHGDDEQLFFAGLLPWYGAELGQRVQVVYFTDHRNLTSARVHEMLDGLWAVGIRDYPVFGSFDDYYTFDLQDAYRYYAAQGQSEDRLLAFFVEHLRRGRPLVAVTHDQNGEYGHGMHKLCAELLKKAVAVSADPEVYPELAARYDVWDVPKTYLHLYPENAITMDWDIPLEAFDGKTAFEVSRDLGFAAHASQQQDFGWFYRGVSRSVDIPKYNPGQYGLYRSTVGADREKDDMFENLRDDGTVETFLQTAPKQDSENAVDKNWPFLPLVGTGILMCLTAFFGHLMG